MKLSCVCVFSITDCFAVLIVWVPEKGFENEQGGMAICSRWDI